MLRLLAALGLIVSTVVGVYSLLGLGLAYSHNSIRGAREAMSEFGLASLGGGRRLASLPHPLGDASQSS